MIFYSGYRNIAANVSPGHLQFGKKDDPRPGPLSDPLSTTQIVLFSLLTSFFVLIVSLLVQKLVYGDWLHQTGPLRIVGTTIAAVITFIFVFNWQAGLRQRRLDALRRFEVIAEMNDRIRNALQVIECVTYISNGQTVQELCDAVDSIDKALQGMVAESSRIPKKPAWNHFRHTA